MSTPDLLTGFDESDRKRIRTLASKFVSAQVERGAIECTDEAIRAAMPAAVKDAKEIIAAVNEYLS